MQNSLKKIARDRKTTLTRLVYGLVIALNLAGPELQAQTGTASPVVSRVRNGIQAELAESGRHPDLIARAIQCYDQVMQDARLLPCTKKQFTETLSDRLSERRLFDLCMHSDGPGAVACLLKADESPRILSSAKNYGLMNDRACPLEQQYVSLCASAQEYQIDPGTKHVFGTGCFEFLQSQVFLDKGSKDLKIPKELHDYWSGMGRGELDRHLIYACQSSAYPRDGKESFDTCARQSAARFRAALEKKSSTGQSPIGYRGTNQFAQAIIQQCRGTR